MKRRRGAKDSLFTGPTRALYVRIKSFIVPQYTVHALLFPKRGQIPNDNRFPRSFGAYGGLNGRDRIAQVDT
jgi:hypothetical protein